MRHKVEEVVLKNGGKGLLIDVPGATTLVSQIVFRAGNRYVKEKRIYETAHLMEHMAFGANGKYASMREFEDTFAKNGAHRNAFTGEVFMAYVFRGADFEWERLLGLQILQITEPKFRADEFEAEKGNVQNEITNDTHDYHWVLEGAADVAAGRNTITVDERNRLVKNVKVDDIREHWERTHTRRNMYFVVSGDLRSKRAKLLELLDGMKLPQGQLLEIVPDRLRAHAPVLVERKEAKSLTFGVYRYIQRELSDQEACAMRFLNHILAGTHSGRILGEARERGLAYGFSSTINEFVGDTEWRIGSMVNYDKAEEIYELLGRVTSELKKRKISNKEVEDARSYNFGSYQQREPVNMGINYYYLNKYGMFDKIAVWNIEPLIRGVTREMICDLAQEFLDSGLLVIGGVGDKEKVQIKDLQERLA
jgi:predicted Zn-dependent peptidase